MEAKMAEQLKLMCILAHPDDESLGFGGMLAKYAKEGIETYLVTATRGERGRFGGAAVRPELRVVGEVREAELRKAGKELGIRDIHFLDYIDGDLDRADPAEAQAKIVKSLRKIRPHVVVTFGPDGAYGHPDHIAISQLAGAALLAAADPDYAGGASDETPHRVSKFYYLAWSKPTWDAYQAAFKKLVVTVDGAERQVAPWPEWAITSVLETGGVWDTVWRAVCCHQTQMEIYGQLEHLSPQHHQALWGRQEYYRVFSSVNGGRKIETDLFEGLRKDTYESRRSPTTKDSIGNATGRIPGAGLPAGGSNRKAL
jgi:LmbE family N-acetylglucosaminyl deacetylase